MRYFNIFSMLAVVLVWTTSTACAQDNGIFSGQGVRFPESNKPVQAKSKWPKLLDFTKDESASTSTTPMPFSSLFANKATDDRLNPQKPAKEKPRFGMPSFEMFKKKPTTRDAIDSPKKFGGLNPLGAQRPLAGQNSFSSPFSSLADKFPKRDPNRPSMLEQMNTKSRDFFDRTTGWAQKKDRKLREDSESTLDAIAKDIRAQNQESDRNTIPAQPPVRTAEAKNGRPVRF